MSKSVEYIKENTKNFSNALFPLETGEFSCKTGNFLSWITPTEARIAVMFAKEETIEKACEYIDGFIELLNNRGYQLKKERIIGGLKQAMKDEEVR